MYQFSKNPQFSKRLINWYLENKRDLPWRETSDPYKIWLSEIMLQQTRIEQGLPYYLKFTEAFPTVFDLAKAPEDKVLKLWQGLGYYSRARNLHFTAKHVAAQLNGVFPDSYADLKKLKGVGDYTAAAIASISFKEPVAVVDGNVFRVLSRVFGVDLPINSTEGKKYFRELAETLLDREQPEIFNQAIMEFGALHCKPKNPLCETCPFNSFCLALKEDRIAGLPVKLKKTKVKKRFFNYLVFQLPDNKTILEQRKSGIWRGLYQYPLVETEAIVNSEELIENDHFQQLLGKKEFSISLFNQQPVVHKLSHQHLYTSFWIVEMNKEHQDAISPDELEDYPVPVLIQNFINEFDAESYK